MKQSFAFMQPKMNFSDIFKITHSSWYQIYTWKQNVPRIQANICFNIYNGFHLRIDISPRISTKLIFNGSCVSSIYADTNVTWSCLFSSVKSLFCQRDDTYLLHLGLVLCYFKITCMTCLYILNFTVTCVPSLERYINNNTQYSITAFLPNYKWSFIDII